MDPISQAHAAIQDGRLKEAHQILQPILAEIQDGEEEIGPELAEILKDLALADAQAFGIAQEKTNA